MQDWSEDLNESCPHSPIRRSRSSAGTKTCPIRSRAKIRFWSGLKACALNHLDLWVRKGLPGVKLPHILGSDVAGEDRRSRRVRQLDSSRTAGIAVAHALLRSLREVRCRTAEPVSANSPCWASRVDGGNCELIAVPPANVIPIPDSLDFNQAASVPLVFLTAWHMLVGSGGIRPGQTVLVLGASSAWASRRSRLRRFSMPR